MRASLNRPAQEGQDEGAERISGCTCPEQSTKPKPGSVVRAYRIGGLVQPLSSYNQPHIPALKHRSKFRCRRKTTGQIVSLDPDCSLNRAGELLLQRITTSIFHVHYSGCPQIKNEIVSRKRTKHRSRVALNIIFLSGGGGKCRCKTVIINRSYLIGVLYSLRFFYAIIAVSAEPLILVVSPAPVWCGNVRSTTG
jgi:hypothetical protein